MHPSHAFVIEYHQMPEVVMEAHCDTFANPVSMALCLEHTCNIPNQAPLFIDPAKFNDPYLSRVTISTGHVGLKDKVAVNLIPGDLGIFRGRDVIFPDSYPLQAFTLLVYFSPRND